MKILRWLFGPRKTEIKELTVGHKDADGFADVILNGKPTNIRLLLFDKEQIERLNKVAEENRKSKGGH